MPSTTSSSVSMAFASSTVMTPSLPTFCIARAIIAPISLSPLAEMVPTWAISALVETLRERDWTSETTAATAMSMPRLTSMAAMIGCSLLLAGFLDDAHHVGFLHDDELFAIQLDFRARPFAEQDAIALLDVERVKRAVLAARAGTDGDDLAFHRLFLGGVGDDDAAGGLVGLLDAADEHTV